MCGESTTTQTGDTSSYIPDWLSNQTYKVGQAATKAVTSNPYQGYGGPTTADFGSTFNVGENAATARAGSADPNFSAGTQSLLQGLGLAGQQASQSVGSLMSQYTGAALQPTLDAIQRQSATANQGLAANATMAGAFGDSGYGTEKAANDRDTMSAISGATANAYDRAYNTALSTQQTALQQLFGGVGQAASLGSSSNQAQTALESLLASMGATRQQAGQTGINTDINVNNQNQMGRLQQLGAASSVLGGLPYNKTGDSTTYTTAPDNTGWGLLGTALSAIPGATGLKLPSWGSLFSTPASSGAAGASAGNLINAS